jgi:DNA topoisomerase-1
MLRETSILNIFPGFLALSREGKDTEGNKKAVLPQLHEKDELNLKEVTKEQRFTQPPPRFTEASLIKELEQWGIGRPSTYAPIISTIIDREYVARETGNLKPTELGIVVNDLLVANFPNVVDLEFTAAMESGLDKVAEEKADWVKLIRDFYTPFSKDLAESAEKIEKVELTPEEVDETCPDCNKNLIVKTGRFGKFLACPSYPECKFTKSYQIKTGVKCPECDGDIVKRKSKKNKTFYGCGNYPDCQFATHMEPFPEPCPKCGSLMVKYRGKTKKCTKCDFKDNI